MTPRVAANHLTLEQDEAEVTSVTRRRFGTASDRRVAVSGLDVAIDNVDARPTASLVWREAIHRRLLGIADVAAAGASLVVVLTSVGARHVGLAATCGVLLVVLLFKISGLYDRDDLRLAHSTLDEAPMLLQLTGLFSLGVAVLETVLLAGRLEANQIAGLWLVAFGMIFFGRVLARALASRTAPPERCLVLGDRDRAERIRQKLAASRTRALVVASMPIAAEEVHDVDWIVMPEIFRRVVENLTVHRIIIAPTTTDNNDVVNLIRTAKAVGVRVSVLPRMFEVVGSSVEFDEIDGMTMLGVRRFGLSRSSRALKRLFDIGGDRSDSGHYSGHPAFAIAIRLESRGPVFFRQVRVGRDGRHFWIFKFRSMVADADAKKDELRALSEAATACSRSE